MADPTSSQSFGGVPEGPLSTRDLVELRFDQALRGYRMDQVDEVIDALSARIHDLESEVASVSAPGGELPAPVEPEDLGGGRDEVSSDGDDHGATREQ